MARFYVEAYRADNTQILGNLDGQISWEGINYKRTQWYRNLRFHLSVFKAVAYYKIVDGSGKVHEIIRR